MTLLIAAFCILVLGLLCVHGCARKRAEEAFWEIDSNRATAEFYNQLRSYCLSQTNYPALPAEQLRERGIFDDEIMALLNQRMIHFYPFSSEDPDDKIIFSWTNNVDLRVGWKVAHFSMDEELTKGQITGTNDPEDPYDLDEYR